MFVVVVERWCFLDLDVREGLVVGEVGDDGIGSWPLML